MRYPLTFYVQQLSPDVGGCANGPIIRILEKYRNDAGIYQHELVHVKQWFITFGIHNLLYMLFDWYRLVSEVEAYREQAKHYPDDRRKLFASYIAKYYNLNILPEEAEQLLRN